MRSENGSKITVVLQIKMIQDLGSHCLEKYTLRKEVLEGFVAVDDLYTFD